MQISQHLNDEHMRMYEWNGAGSSAGLATRTVPKSRWHASYAVLAALTSLLILNGCDTQETATLSDDSFEQSAADAQPAYNEGPVDSVEAGAPGSDMSPQPEAVAPVEGGQPLDENAAPVESTPPQP